LRTLSVLKRRYDSTRLHGVTFQKTAIFKMMVGHCTLYDPKFPPARSAILLLSSVGFSDFILFVFSLLIPLCCPFFFFVDISLLSVRCIIYLAICLSACFIISGR